MAFKHQRLSKSRYLAGLQCHRQLWWRVHDAHAPELRAGPGLQAIFDTGHRVGERARQEFPDATLIDLDHRNPGAAVEATRRAIAEGAPVILEASFIEDHIFVAVDVLSKEADGWVVTEVKGTAGVKAQHIPDAAVQAHVVERAGLPVARIELMHLNREHRHPDQGSLFRRADISEQVAALRGGIDLQATAQLQMLESGVPEVEAGARCTSPYPCPFLARCNDPLPEHSIEDLHRIGQKKLGELRDDGIDTVDQIPSDYPLTDIQRRHREAILQNEMVVVPGLQAALAACRYPIAMLDFETIGLTLPVWDGCSPFDKVPVQFSVHTIDEDGEVSHQAYLADGEGDPRASVAEALVPALDRAATIVVWNAQFEKACLAILAESSPMSAAALHDASDKVEDLLPVVRNHVYHPEFHGSFSLKSVVPALLPDMAYDALEVSDGQAASALLEQLLCRPGTLTTEERASLRQDLLAYCNHDTAVMVELFRSLSELA